MKLRLRYCMTVRAGARSVDVRYTSRDLKALFNLPKLPFPEGEAFMIAAGIYANYSVAKGQDTDAWVERPRAQLLKATLALRDGARRERTPLEEFGADWLQRVEPLLAFLRSSRASKVRIRHHYG
jgi:hypothetical protein